MADAAIDASVYASLHLIQTPSAGICWRSTTVGYQVYVDSDNDYKYSKTTDGGATWGVGVKIADGDGEMVSGVWCDWWTEGDTGTKIHFIGNNTAAGWTYRALDTAADTLGTAVIVGTDFAFGATWEYGATITKARGGNLYAQLQGGGADTAFWRSVDGGANWTARTNAPVSDGTDYCKLLPAYVAADNQDIACFIATSSLTLYFYDNSANTWGSGTDLGACNTQQTYFPFDAVVDFATNRAVFAMWAAHDTATADLQTGTTILDGTFDVDNGANALTDSAETAGVSLEINQITGAIRVYYLTGTTFGTTCGVWRKESTDATASWGAAVKQSEAADTALTAVFSSQSVGGNSVAGRHQVSWFSDTLNDLMTSKVNGSDVAAAAAANYQRPVVVRQATQRAAVW